MSVLFVATQYDRAANTAWYQHICQLQGLDPYQVSEQLSPLFTRANKWHNAGVIDQIICFGEYGAFAGTMIDKLGLQDLSQDPSFNMVCSIKKEEATIILNQLLRKLKRSAEEEEMGLLNELIEYAGGYLHCSPCSDSEPVLHRELCFDFFRALNQGVSVKDRKTRAQYRGYPTLTRRALTSIIFTCSPETKEALSNLLMYKDSIDWDASGQIEYDDVPFHVVTVGQAMERKSQPTANTLVTLLFVLGVLSIHPTDAGRLRTPNLAMQDHVCHTYFLLIHF